VVTRLASVSEHRMTFQERLEAIEVELTQMFALISEDLGSSTEALLSGDKDVVTVLAERDLVIDSIYRELEDLASVAIALEAPVAADLRFLLSVLRIVPELERSHDLVVDIARHANHSLSGDLSPRSRALVARMGTLGAEMWRRAADSWYERDPAAAALLEERDDEMDGLHAALIAELASGRMALPVTMDMTLVARLYERLGDHAVNIAKRVVYLAGRRRPE
jgi:phosphate transport system protein